MSIQSQLEIAEKILMENNFKVVLVNRPGAARILAFRAAEKAATLRRRQERLGKQALRLQKL